MGVGRPQDILDAIATGIDLFDCVMPTRNGRNATCLTDRDRSSFGTPRIVATLGRSRRVAIAWPVDGSAALTCDTCFIAKEMLGPILASIHNLTYLHRLTCAIAQAIAAGRFVQLRAEVLEALGP